MRDKWLWLLWKRPQPVTMQVAVPQGHSCLHFSFLKCYISSNTEHMLRLITEGKTHINSILKGYNYICKKHKYYSLEHKHILISYNLWIHKLRNCVNSIKHSNVSYSIPYHISGKSVTCDNVKEGNNCFICIENTKTHLINHEHMS
jgi:hypothetical protein